jgi:60 kDa SS-A/Ro ribonucleoprotein
MSIYRDFLNGRNSTPQSEQAKPEQVKNSAGGYVFKVSTTTAIDRFLILGSDTPTYYASAQTLTQENAKAITAYAQKQGNDLVERILDVSVNGRAPKNSPALLALAIAASVGDEGTRRAAFDVLPKVARTSTHLFEFVEYLDSMRGWGRAPRRAVGEWYVSKTPEQVAYQAVKYRQRNGWTHRDVLRLAHPETADGAMNDVLKWITQPDAFTEATSALPTYAGLPQVIRGFEHAKNAMTSAEAAELITYYGLPWEAIPDAYINTPEVWKALVPTMGMTALMRNASRVARLPESREKSQIEEAVAERLADPEMVRKGRLHPVNILTAMRTYAAGRSQVGYGNGGSTWTPNRLVTDALDEAFYASFKYQEPTGKRYLVALDVSGSMGAEVKPGLTARDVSAAMAMSLLATEPNVDVVGFTAANTQARYGQRRYSQGYDPYAAALTPLDLSPRRRLDDNVAAVRGLPFGRTDCALPARWAREQGKDYDAIVIFTDSETWAGRQEHPFQALTKYRKQVGHKVAQIVVGLTATDFTIADPSDPDSLDVVGFDSALPGLISEFTK